MKKKVIIFIICLLFVFLALSIIPITNSKYKLSNSFDLTLQPEEFNVDVTTDKTEIYKTAISSDTVSLTVTNNQSFPITYNLNVNSVYYDYIIGTNTANTNLTGEIIEDQGSKTYVISIDHKDINNKVEEEISLIVDLVGPYRSTIQKKVSIIPAEGIIDVWDVSTTKDRSILAYAYDEDEDGYYEIEIETQDNASASAYLIANVNTNSGAYFGNSAIDKTLVETVSFINKVKCNTNSLTFIFAYIGNRDNLDETAIYNMENLDISQPNTTVLGMFQEYRGKSIDLTTLDTTNITVMRNMFFGSYFETLDLSNFDTTNVTNMTSMFSDMKNIKELDLSSLNTSNVTVAPQMFQNCTLLESVNLSNWDFRDVSSMKYMFSGNRNLKTLTLTNFRTQKVTDMSYMFYNCNSLTSIDLSSFDTTNVTDMSQMFTLNSNLTSLNITSFVTTSLTNTERMFYRCSSLTSMDLSNFNTPNLMSAKEMFAEMTSLQSLDIRNMITSGIANFESMFYNDTSLTNIDMRTAEFLEGSYHNDTMFYRVPTGINVMVKNQDSQTWIQDALGEGVGTVTIATQ